MGDALRVQCSDSIDRPGPSLGMRAVRCCDATVRCPGESHRFVLRRACAVLSPRLCARLPSSRCGTRMTVDEQIRLNFWEKLVRFGDIPWKMMLHALIVVFATAWILGDNIWTVDNNVASKRSWHAALLPKECSTLGAGDNRDWPQDQLWLSTRAQLKCTVESAVRGYYALPSSSLDPVTVARPNNAADAATCANGIMSPTIVVDTWALESASEHAPPGPPLRALASPPYTRTTYVAANSSFVLPDVAPALLRGVWVFLEAEVANLQEERLEEHGCVRWSLALVAEFTRGTVAHVRLRSQGNSCSGLRRGREAVCEGDQTDGESWGVSFWREKSIPLALLVLCVAYQLILTHGAVQLLLVVVDARRGRATERDGDGAAASGPPQPGAALDNSLHPLLRSSLLPRAGSSLSLVSLDRYTDDGAGGAGGAGGGDGDGDGDAAAARRSVVSWWDALRVVVQPSIAVLTLANALLIFSAIRILAMEHPYELGFTDSESGTGAAGAGASAGAPQWPHTSNDAEGLNVAQSFGTFLTCAAMIAFIASSSRFNALFETVAVAGPKVAKMMLGVAPVFIGAVMIATGLMGECAERYSSIGKSAITLFAVMNGDVMRESFLAANQGICAQCVVAWRV